MNQILARAGYCIVRAGYCIVGLIVKPSTFTSETHLGPWRLSIDVSLLDPRLPLA